MADCKLHSCVSNRYMISFMAFLGLLISVGYRTSFALVVTHIVKFNNSDSSSVSNNDSSGSIFPGCTTVNTSRDREVTWSHSGYFHSAFFAGQFVASLPAGILASRYSPKWLFGTTILTTSVLFLILPKASEGPEAGIFVIRALQGIAEAIAVPAMNAFISSVATKTDRSRLINIAYAGAYLSPALALFTTGATTCYVSWDSIIYIYASVGAVWSFVWLIVMDNNPPKPNAAAPGEKDRLLGHIVGSKETVPIAPNQIPPPPWRKFLTSLPVLAVWIASFCRNFIFAILIMEVQQYFKDVFDMPTATIGLLSAIPHICMAVFMMPASVTFDTLIKKKLLSITKVRKLAQFMGYGVQGACFLAIGFVDHYMVTFALLCVGMAFSACAISGFQTNPLDLAPQYAGPLTGIARTGMLGSVLSTAMASALTVHRSKEEWQHVFIITGSIHLAGVLFYVIFASGNVQPWARRGQELTSKENEDHQCDRLRIPRN